MKILIMGLPGSGKTYLAKRFSKIIKADWFNADKIRGRYNDWDFSHDGIIRQVNRMKKLADKSKKKFVIADFVCPLDEQIKIFNPKIIVWMDTITKSRFKTMNRLFKPPTKWHIRIKKKDIEINLIKLKDKIKKYQWKDYTIATKMVGTFNPWNSRHRTIFEKRIKEKGQVTIFVKNLGSGGTHSSNYNKVKNIINDDLFDFKGRYKILKFQKYYTLNK